MAHSFGGRKKCLLFRHRNVCGSAIFWKGESVGLAVPESCDSLLQPAFVPLGNDRGIKTVGQGVANRQSYPQTRKTARSLKANNALHILELFMLLIQQLFNLDVNGIGKFAVRLPSFVGKLGLAVK